MYLIIPLVVGSFYLPILTFLVGRYLTPSSAPWRPTWNVLGSPYGQRVHQLAQRVAQICLELASSNPPRNPTALWWEIDQHWGTGSTSGPRSGVCLAPGHRFSRPIRFLSPPPTQTQNYYGGLSLPTWVSYNNHVVHYGLYSVMAFLALLSAYSTFRRMMLGSAPIPNPSLNADPRDEQHHPPSRPASAPASPQVRSLSQDGPVTSSLGQNQRSEVRAQHQVPRTRRSSRIWMTPMLIHNSTHRPSTSWPETTEPELHPNPSSLSQAGHARVCEMREDVAENEDNAAQSEALLQPRFISNMLPTAPSSHRSSSVLAPVSAPNRQSNPGVPSECANNSESDSTDAGGVDSNAQPEAGPSTGLGSLNDLD